MMEAPTKRLTDEQAELAADYWDKAMRHARIQAAKHPTMNLDWESAAAFGLCKAAFRFVPERGNKFWTVASRCIKFAFIDLMRDEAVKGYGRTRGYEGAPLIFSMDAEVITGHRGNTELSTRHAIIADETLPTGWEEQSIDFVYGETERLPKMAREIVRLYYCHGLTLKQAGEQVGIGESRAGQVHKKALSLLRRTINPETYDRRAAS